MTVYFPKSKTYYFELPSYCMLVMIKKIPASNFSSVDCVFNYFQECIFINKSQSSGLLVYDYIQLFK